MILRHLCKGGSKYPFRCQVFFGACVWIWHDLDHLRLLCRRLTLLLTFNWMIAVWGWWGQLSAHASFIPWENDMEPSHASSAILLSLLNGGPSLHQEHRRRTNSQKRMDPVHKDEPLGEPFGTPGEGQGDGRHRCRCSLDLGIVLGKHSPSTLGDGYCSIENSTGD